MLNPSFYLDAAARRCPDATAIVHNGNRYSYRQLHELANRAANGLKQAGFDAGDRLALCCVNRPGFIITYYAMLKIGATIAMLSPGLKPRDIAIQLEDSGARALFCFDGIGNTTFAETAFEAAETVETCTHLWVLPEDPMGASTVSGIPSLADLMEGNSSSFQTVACDEDATAIIPYTSGTTGLPKGVEITHANISSMVMLNLPLADWDAGRIRLVANPLFHVMGQIAALNLPIMCGQTLVLMERFEPQAAWRLIVDEGITYIAGVPVLFKSLLDNAADVDAAAVRRTLQLCGTGAAPLRPEWSDEFDERFGAPLLPGYGATETTSVVTWNCPFDALNPISVGKPIPGVEVKIVGPDGAPVGVRKQGEILVRSPGVMKGYFGRPDATAKVLRDGWYWTGDIGTQDQDGYLYISGRKDEMILRRDANVSPKEIEEIMREHPLVEDAAVIGVPSKLVGQDVVALFVPVAGETLDEETMRNWLANELPDDQFPDVIQMRMSFPLTDTGKIARHLLKSEYSRAGA